jgi:hypothetical protein
MLNDFEIVLIVISLFLTPIFCLICHRSYRNHKEMRHNKIKNIRIKPINYEVFIDKNIQELKKTNEFIDVEYV